MFTKYLRTVIPKNNNIFFTSRACFNEYEGGRQQFFKKSYIKPFTVINESNMISFTCLKGKFKQINNYLTLDKLGAVLMEFLPLLKDSENQQQFDIRGKKNFAISPKNMGHILKINPYTLQESEFNLEFNYSINSQNEEKFLTFRKKAKEENIEVVLKVQKGSEKPVESKVRMEISEFVVFQELTRYSLPYVMGWHILDSPRIAEEEYASTGNENVNY